MKKNEKQKTRFVFVLPKTALQNNCQTRGVLLSASTVQHISERSSLKTLQLDNNAKTKLTNTHPCGCSIILFCSKSLKLSSRVKCAHVCRRVRLSIFFFLLPDLSHWQRDKTRCNAERIRSGTRVVTFYDNGIVFALLAGDKFRGMCEIHARFSLPRQGFRKNPLFSADSLIPLGLTNAEEMSQNFSDLRVIWKVFEDFRRIWTEFIRRASFLSSLLRFCALICVVAV